jgi:hypothetical protein
VTNLYLQLSIKNIFTIFLLPETVTRIYGMEQVFGAQVGGARSGPAGEWFLQGFCPTFC